MKTELEQEYEAIVADRPCRRLYNACQELILAITTALGIGWLCRKLQPLLKKKNHD